MYMYAYAFRIPSWSYYLRTHANMISPLLARSKGVAPVSFQSPSTACSFSHDWFRHHRPTQSLKKSLHRQKTKLATQRLSQLGNSVTP